MTKEELSQLFYLDKEIKRLKRRKKFLELDLKTLNQTVDSVLGSEHQEPFRLHSVKVEGIAITDKKRWLNIKAELQDVQNLIELKLEQQVCEYNRISRYIQSVDDSFIRQILELRFIEMLEWEDVAAEIEGNNTEDSVRMACNRFLKKKVVRYVR